MLKTTRFSFLNKTVSDHRRVLAQRIIAWCEDLGDEMVVEAMKLACLHGVRKWCYVEAVLRDWASRGYETVEDIKNRPIRSKNITNPYGAKRPAKNRRQGRDIPDDIELDFSAGEDPEW